MTTLALKIDQARRKPCTSPDIRTPIFLAYSADTQAVQPHVHRAGVLARAASSLNRGFAFALVIVSCIAFNAIGAAAAWYVDDLDIRTLVSDLRADASLPPPMQQIGIFDRESGRRG